MTENLVKIQRLIDTLPIMDANTREERDIYSYLLNSSTDGYWIIKFPNEKPLRDYTLEEVREWDEFLNPTFKKILGYEDNELENKCKSWIDLIHPEDLPRAYNELLNHLEKGDPYYLVVRYKHKDKEGYPLRIVCRGQAIFDEQGTPIKMVGTHTLIPTNG